MIWNINERINAKGNAVDIPPHFWKDRERHAESIGYEQSRPRRLMTTNYERIGWYSPEKIKYRQDRKTNEREPSEPDYNAPTQVEQSEYMARIQRELK